MRENVLQVQKYLNKQGAEPKLIEDGFWGTKTAHAYEQMVARKRIALHRTSPWPNSSDAAVTAFFGPHGEEGGYTPPMATVELPFKMYLYTPEGKALRTISVHKKIAEPYERVMHRIWEHFNQDQAALDETRYTLFFGCYNPRPMRNSRRWSKHAWGIATDHDANRNQLQSSRAYAWMPEEIIDLYETEGFMSLGRYTNRDYMHFEATLP